MKTALLITELIITLAFSFAGVAAIVAGLSMLVGVKFNFLAAVVIWFAWFGINTIRSKLDERND